MSHFQLDRIKLKCAKFSQHITIIFSSITIWITFWVNYTFNHCLVFIPRGMLRFYKISISSSSPLKGFSGPFLSSRFCASGCSFFLPKKKNAKSKEGFSPFFHRERAHSTPLQGAGCDKGQTELESGERADVRSSCGRAAAEHCPSMDSAHHCTNNASCHVVYLCFLL